MSKSSKGPAQPLLNHDAHGKGDGGDRVDHKASAAAAVAIELEIAAQVLFKYSDLVPYLVPTVPYRCNTFFAPR
jgi:hypothetical protein